MTSALAPRLAIALIAAVAMLAVPVSPHDWGDDFALYILQAAGFTDGGSPADLFVYNPAYPTTLYSPPTYPPGFPVMLAPLYAVVGLDLRAFQTYMSVLLLATGFVTYRYAYRRLGSALISAAVALVVIFHGAALDLKQFVLSDIPYALFTIWFLDSAEDSSEIPLAVALVVIAWLVRSIGILAVMAWGCDALMRIVGLRDRSPAARKHLMGAVAAAAIVGALWFLMRDAQGYDSALRQIRPFTTLQEQFTVNRELLGFYVGDMFGYALLPVVLAGLAGLLVIGAWASCVRDGRTLGLWFTVLYVALLLGYPHPRGGFRLVFPLVPICWTYIARGCLIVGEYLPARRLIGPAFAVVLMMLTARQVYEFSVRPFPSSAHPQTGAAGELFAAMQRSIQPADLTLSGKPRALALFAARKGIAVSPDASDAAVDQTVAEWRVQYVVSGEPLRNAAITRYCARHPDRVIFRNDAFTLCRTN